MKLPSDTLRQVVLNALREDVGHGDITTQAAIPADLQASADFVMREPAVIAGLEVIETVFSFVDPAVRVSLFAQDGDRVEKGASIARISGPAQAILTGERVALNILQRMCGIATMTARYTDLVRDLPVRILDTRKTTPGLRALEKYAVRMGGGTNHRFGLFDGVMLKDNHLAMLASRGIDIGEAVRRTRAQVGPMVSIEVEADSIEQARQAAEAGADMILLDNMPPAMLREAVAVIAGRSKIEASGGITFETLRAVAETGVDFISSGALTHSARALDIGLDISM
jgi:nicotinate-nucleotide pyrophosphorylase (carboxylating)